MIGWEDDTLSPIGESMLHQESLQPIIKVEIFWNLRFLVLNISFTIV